MDDISKQVLTGTIDGIRDSLDIKVDKTPKRDLSAVLKNIIMAFERLALTLNPAQLKTNPLLAPIRDVTNFSELLSNVGKVDWAEVIRDHNESYYVHLIYLCEIEELNHAAALKLDDAVDINTGNFKYFGAIETITKGLRPLLSDLDIFHIWQGALMAMESNNPDKIRHCFISLRTIIEYFLNKRNLVNKSDVSSVDPSFDQSRQPGVKLKLKAFLFKEEFGYIDKLSDLHLHAFTNYYSSLSSLHSPSIGGVTEKNANILVAKIGIIIWAMAQKEKLFRSMEQIEN